MLTNLENAALGVIFQNQPCTAYAVRKVFASSLSSHWSGSTGSIYPLIRRLLRQRLIAAVRRKADRRRSKLYRLTPRGKTQLAKWVGPPMPSGSDLIGFDPLRARFRFLNVLSPSQARRAIKDADTRLRQLLTQIRTENQSTRGRDPLARLSHRGAELAVLAQQQWLKELLNDQQTD